MYLKAERPLSVSGLVSYHYKRFSFQCQPSLSSSPHTASSTTSAAWQLRRLSACSAERSREASSSSSSTVNTRPAWSWSRSLAISCVRFTAYSPRSLSMLLPAPQMAHSTATRITPPMTSTVTIVRPMTSIFIASAFAFSCARTHARARAIACARTSGGVDERMVEGRASLGLFLDQGQSGDYAPTYSKERTTKHATRYGIAKFLGSKVDGFERIFTRLYQCVTLGF